MSAGVERRNAMSIFQLDKCLFQIVHEPRRWEAFLARPADVLDHYELDAPEREALIARDVRALNGLGANGYLIAGFAGRLGLFGRPQANQVEMGVN